MHHLVFQRNQPRTFKVLLYQHKQLLMVSNFIHTKFSIIQQD